MARNSQKILVRSTLCTKAWRLPKRRFSLLLTELLEAVPEAGLELLNPGVNTSRIISGIDSSETPDIAFFIAEGVLLLTTAMVFKDDQCGLVQMIEQLSNANTVGIAIKLGRFIDEVSPEVLAIATELDYPVFKIPEDTTLGVTYHKLQSHIWGNETRQVYQALEIQKTISRLLFKGATLSEMLQYLAHSIQNDVLYFDYFFDLSSFGTAHRAGRPDEQLAAEIGAQLGEIHINKPIAIIDEFHLETSSGQINCIVAPIEAGNTYPGFLTILYHDQIPDPLLYAITEQASMVLSFHAHNTRRLHESTSKQKEELFKRLLQKKSYADPSILDSFRLVSSFPMIDLGSYQVVAAGFDAGKLAASEKNRDHFSLVHLWLDKQTAHLKERCVLIPLRESDHLFLFIRETQAQLTVLLQTMAEELARRVNIVLRFGIGNQAHTIESLNSSYIEAVTAMNKALEDQELSLVRFYDSEGITELLQFAPEGHIRHYCTHILHKLAYPESEYDQSLRDTLEAFLDCQCDITQTARQLYIHRNTVRYRITKIQKHLERPLDDPEFTLQLRLAMYLTSEQA